MPSEPPLPVLRETTHNVVIARRVHQPRGMAQWALGLLVRPRLRSSEALWLNPCGGIHTWGMRYAIDVIFLDPKLRVVGVARGVKPWRFALARRGTRSVVELAAGGADRVQVGDQMAIEPA